MSLFAIADLHFGTAVNKPMDRFGENWRGHTRKIIENWEKNISPEDTVLLPGDISWGMRFEDAAADLDIIAGLPGRKILVGGNHDYWWTSSAKLEKRYPGMRFLKNACDWYEDWAICGARGWLCPNDARFGPHDEKIYEREQVRLRLSLNMALAAGAEKILLMLHFPPMNDKLEPSAFTEIIEEYAVQKVVYGHLHGKESHSAAFQGIRNGTAYTLVSSDYLDFCPQKIMETGRTLDDCMF